MGKIQKKYNEINVGAKKEIYNKLNKGQSVLSLSKEYGVSTKTIYNIKNGWKKGIGEIDDDRKRKGFLKYAKTDDALFKWYCNQRSKGIPITGSSLKTTAISFSGKLHETSFGASNGWLRGFQQRHNITSQVASGEKLSVDESGIEDFKAEIQQLLDNKVFSLEELYNADETGL